MREKIAVIGTEAIFGRHVGRDEYDRAIYDGLQCYSEWDAQRGNALPAGSPVAQLPAHIVAEGPAALAQRVYHSLVAHADLEQEDVEKVGLILVGDALQQLTESESEALSMQARYHCQYVGEALAQAEHLLREGDHPIVAIMALQWLGDEAAAQANSETPSLSLDAAHSGYVAGEGCGAVLLTRESLSTSMSGAVYALIEAHASDSGVESACQQALQNANLAPSDLNYIELAAGADTDKAHAELSGLVSCYRGNDDLTLALGSARTSIGECGVAGAMASLIKVIHCLDLRYLPGTNQWQEPAQPQLWSHTPFYVPEDSRSWFLDSHHRRRVSGLSVQDNGHYTHIVLAENKRQTHRSSHYLALVAPYCFPLFGNSQPALQAALKELSEVVASSNSLHKTALDYYHRYQINSTKAQFALMVLGENREELIKEIDAMQNGVNKAFAGAVEFKTPKGSFFTTKPLGGDGSLAFVYPGVGAAYVGLGKDLFHLFPNSYNTIEAMSRDLGKMLKEEILYPKRQEKLSFKERKTLDHSLRMSLSTISECGVAFAYLYSKVFRDFFGLSPDAALGYSMGEVSMWTAMDAWHDPGCLSKRLADSPTFNYQLTGDLLSLRALWGEPPPPAGPERLWETYSVKATADQAAEAIAGEERAYMTIINTPNSVVLGGEPEACQRVIDRLGTKAMAMDISSAIHSQPAMTEYQNMVELYSLEAAERQDLNFYSSSCYLPVPQRGKAIAHSIAKCFCDQLDFPRLVNRVYDDGARIFIEMGAGRSCCTWIDRILKDRPDGHVTIPVNAKGTPDHLTLARAAAKLVSHGVAIDLSPFYLNKALSGRRSNL